MMGREVLGQCRLEAHLPAPACWVGEEEEEEDPLPLFSLCPSCTPLPGYPQALHFLRRGEFSTAVLHGTAAVWTH